MKTTPERLDELDTWHSCRNGDCACGAIFSEFYDGPVANVVTGEWGDEYPAIRLVGRGPTEKVAEAYMERIGYGSIPEEAARIHRLLIAATPDLLRAVKGLLELLPPDLMSSPQAEQARAAISKSEIGDPQRANEAKELRRKLYATPLAASPHDGDHDGDRSHPGHE